MGKHLIIRFRRNDEVFAFPRLPVDEVARDSKSVEGVILTTGVVGLEVEHDVEVVHLHNLSITRDDATYLISEDGVALVALPFFQVVGEGDAYAFSLQIVFWVDTSSVIEHHETLAQCFLWVVIDGTLILYQFLPPLHVFIVDAEQGLVARLPFMCLSDVAIRPGYANVQWFANSLITSAMSTDVGQPIVLLEFGNTIAPSPCPVDECRESTTLVHVPSVLFIRKDASLGIPM